jgi:hypothetical protein
MIQSIFIEVKGLLHTAMMDTIVEGDSSAEKLKKMWFAMFAFILKNPEKFTFQEAVDASQILDKTGQAELENMAKDIRRILQEAIDDKTLRPLPIDSLVSLMQGPAVVLSRRMITAGRTDISEAEPVFASIWRGVAL